MVDLEKAIKSLASNNVDYVIVRWRCHHTSFIGLYYSRSGFLLFSRKGKHFKIVRGAVAI